MIANRKNGIRSYELSRALGVRQKTLVLRSEIRDKPDSTGPTTIDEPCPET